MHRRVSVPASASRFPPALYSLDRSPGFLAPPSIPTPCLLLVGCFHAPSSSCCLDFLTPTARSWLAATASPLPLLPFSQSTATMERRTFESHMEWEYQNQGPMDHTSPFVQSLKNGNKSSTSVGDEMPWASRCAPSPRGHLLTSMFSPAQTRPSAPQQRRPSRPPSPVRFRAHKAPPANR